METENEREILRLKGMLPQHTTGWNTETAKAQIEWDKNPDGTIHRHLVTWEAYDELQQQLAEAHATADKLLAALRDTYELISNSDVKHYISTKLGEQARAHSAISKARAAIARAEKGRTAQ